MNKTKRCGLCGGWGAYLLSTRGKKEPTKCENCDGKGVLPSDQFDEFGMPDGEDYDQW